MLDEPVRAAQADAWLAEGRLRTMLGGGAAALPGVRLMASGLPHAKWNTGVVEDVQRVDLAAVRAWYASRAFGAGVPWGLLVPAGIAFRQGRLLAGQRCMGLRQEGFVPAGLPKGLVICAAGRADVDRVAHIDAEAFGEPVGANRDWIVPHLGAAGFTVAIAWRDGVPVATGTAIETCERAGPCVGIFGVAVVARARRQGVGSALTAWLIARAFAGGATLAHLNPDTEAAARLYRRLGFVATAGFDIFVDIDRP